jgi:hypothetical protein
MITTVRDSEKARGYAQRHRLLRNLIPGASDFTNPDPESAGHLADFVRQFRGIAVNINQMALVVNLGKLR